MAKKPKYTQKTFHLDKRAAAIVAAATGDDDEVLSEASAAAFIGVSVVWLRKRRLHGDGPRFIRLSPRIIGYRRGDLKRWLKKRTYTKTSQYERFYQGKRLRAGEAAP